jgi:hypothetical protein
MKPPEFVEVALKPMLAECVQEAVKLALIDSCWPVDEATGEDRAESWTPEERAAMRRDIHTMPSSAMSRIDPQALARNVAVRLLGTGGWFLPSPRGGDPIYTGNATSREVFEASFERPDRDQIAEMGFDLGLRPTEDGMFEMPESDDDA